MGASENELEKSIHKFEQKKNACLGFTEKLIAIKRSYDNDFGGGETGRLAVEKLENLKNKIADEKLKILVAGQFKTGKSTLLNAMLGEEVLPADVLPCTAVITEIEYGKKPAACLYFRENLDQNEFPEGLREDIKAHLAKAGEKTPEPLSIDISQPEVLSGYLSIPMGMEQKEGVKASPYARCVVQWPLELCRGGAVIIDSPGLNEHEARDATTMGYLDQADMIVHVLNAQQICGMPDKKFIEDVLARGQAAFPIIFVVNRFDQIDAKSQNKIKKYAFSLKELNGIYGKEGIFFTSAQNALAARQNGDETQVELSGLGGMERKIAAVFEKDRMSIKLGHMREICADLDEFALNALPDTAKMLEQNADTLAREYRSRQGEIDSLEKQIVRIKARVDRSINRFDNAFRKELELFFKDFVNISLPEIVENTPLDIDAFHREESQARARDELNLAVNETLKEKFKAWCYNDARKLETEAIEEISAEIVEDIREFNKDLGRLRAGLGLKPLDFGGTGIIGIGDYLPDMLAGAGIGGALGGAAVFICGRFLPLIAGPVGWAIGILSAIASIYLLMDNERARKKFRDNYLSEARKGLLKNLDSHVDEIARTYSGRFREGMAMLYNLLSQRIDDARKPVETAIATLRESGARLERSRGALKKYSQEFNELRLEAKGIMAGIG